MRTPLLSCALVALAGCNLHPSNNEEGAPINLARAGEHVVVTRGSAGLEVLRASDGQSVSKLAADGDADSYDDVTFSGAFVVALDADDGWLRVLALDAAGKLTPIGDPTSVAVGPYSGVSARAGRVVVSGGTCEISLFSISDAGALRSLGTAEAFRGQPDVTLTEDGAAAILSTHFSGSESEFKDGAEFGISALSVGKAAAILDTLGLKGAGFTDGGGTPASWPTRTAVVGSTAYVAHGGGLSLVLVDADYRLTALADLDLPFAAVDVAVSGDTAYVVGAAPASLATVDVRDPSAPALVSVESLKGDPTAVVATTEAVFVATASGVERIVR